MATTVQELLKKRKEREAQAEAGASPSASSGVQKLLDRRRAAYATSVQQEIVDRTTKWLENSNTYIKNYQNRVNHRADGVYVDDAVEAFDRYSEQLSRFDTEATAIKKGLDTYGVYYDPEFVKQITDILDESSKTQAEIIKNLQADRDYWSKWSGAEEYNKAYDNTIYGKKYDGASYAEIMRALERTGGRERAWLEKNRDSYMSSEDAQTEIDAINEKLKKPLGGIFGYYTYEELEEDKKLKERLSTLEGIRDTAKRKEIVAQYDQYKQPAAEMAAKIQALYSQQEQDKTYHPPEWAERNTEGLRQELAIPENVDNETYENNVKLLGFSSVDAFEAWKENLEKTDDERFLDKVKNNFSQSRLAPYFDALQNPKIGSQFSIDVYTGSNKNWKYLEKEEIQVYEYLLLEYGSEKADQYLSDMEIELDRRAAVKGDEELAKDIEESGALTSLGYTALSVLTKPIGGIASLLDNAVQSLEGALNGKPYNPYSEGQTTRRLTSGIRQNVSKKIDKAVEGTFLEGKIFGQNTMSFLYNAVMSATDSIVGATTLGPLYMIAMAGDASGEMAERLYEQGASGSQIFARSLAAGVAEYITEKVSVEKLLDFKNPAFKGQIVKEILKQAGVEATEEMASDVLNLIADSVIMASQSDMAQAIQRYTEGYYDENGVYHPGVSKEEATKKAWGDFFIDTLADGLAGAISGGLGGLVSVGVQAGQNVKAGKQILEAGRAAELIEKGQAASDGSQAKKIADRLAKQKEAGKKLSPMAVGALKQTKLQDLRASVGKRQYTSRAEIEQALANAGIENASAIAESFDRVQRGEANEKDLAILKENDKATEILQSVVVENELRTLSNSAETMKEMERIDSLASREFSRYDSGKKGATTLTESGETVVIEGVKAARDGELIFRLADGREVSSTDVTFASTAEAELYAELARSEIQPGVMKNVVDHYNGETSAKAYVRGMETAYLYGWAGIPAGQLASLPQLASLNEVQRGFAYDLGRIRALDEDAKKTTRLKNLVEASRKTKNGKKGRVILEGVSSRDALTERQKASKGFCELAAKILGINIHLFESDVQDGVRGYTPKDGDRITDNGFYDPVTGDIWLDINAGAEGRGLTVFTLAHELAHFISQWSPEKFRILSDFLMETYGKKGVSVEELISAQRAYAKEQGRELTFREAWEEVVGDSMETLLNDGRVMERIAALKKRDGRLADKIMGYIRRFVDRVTAAYENEVPDSKEGKTVAGWAKEEIEALQDRFADALYDASETFQKTDVSRMETSEGVKHQFRGKNKDGIEVYETSAETRKLPVKKRQKVFLDIMRHQFRGRTAKFIRNGHAYYALFETDDIKKNIYGDKRSDKKGIQAKIKAGAEGDIFDLVENAAYTGSKPEIGKNIQAHQGVSYWDYFVKTVQIDNQVFDLVANVRKKSSGGFVYSIQLNENKKIKASPSLAPNTRGLNRMLNASTNSVPQSDPSVNSQDTQNSKKYSTRRRVASDEKTDVSRMETSEVAGHDGQERTYNDFSASDYYQNSELYSYDFLTRQKDMEAVNLPKTGALAGKNGRIDDEKVIENGKKNAIAEGIEKNGKIYVANTYTGRSLRIDVQTIRHGLDGTYSRHLTNARIGSMIGSVVKNAIPVNGLKNTAEKAVGTYAMVSYCHDSMGRQFIAVITVEQYSDNVESFELYDVAHAVSGRQKKSSQVDTKSQGVNPIKAATISIADLLQIVKSTHQSILSDDVLARLGEKRNPKGSYTDKVLFSTRREGTSARALLEGVDESEITDRDVLSELREYKETLAALDAAEARYTSLKHQAQADDPTEVKTQQEELRRAKEAVTALKQELYRMELGKALSGILDQERAEANKQGAKAAAEYRRQEKERRDVAVSRDKLKKKVIELSRLLNRSTKKKRVLSDMQRPVEEILSVLANAPKRTEAEYDRQIAELQAEISRCDLDLAELRSEKALVDGRGEDAEAVRKRIKAAELERDAYENRIAKALAERDVETGGAEKLTGAITKLKDVYDRLATEEDTLDAEELDLYDQRISEKLGWTLETLREGARNGEPLSAAAKWDLLLECAAVVERAVRRGGRLFDSQRSQTLTEIRQSVYEELASQDRKTRREGRSGLRKLLKSSKKFSLDNLQPDVLLQFLGSEELRSLATAAADAELIYGRDVDEANGFFHKVAEETGFFGWNREERIPVVFDGKETSVSLGELMSLYALYRRPAGKRHLIEGGGFTHGTDQTEKTALGEVGISNEGTYQPTETELKALFREKLTEEQRRFVERMTAYLSKEMAHKGNSVSQIFYGIDLFGDPHYFPVKVDENYRSNKEEDKRGGNKGSQRIVSRGMTKPLDPKATAPLVVSDFFTVWSGHVGEMAAYHGAVGLENFTRVWEGKFRSAEGKLISLKTEVKRLCGEDYVKYVDTWIEHCNRNIRRGEDSIEGFDKLVRGYKKAATYAKLSVVVQQGTSEWRAYQYIPKRYFEIFHHRLLPGQNKALWEEMKRHCPLAVLKEMGGYDMTGGSLASYMLGPQTRIEKLEDFLGRAPAWADELTWVRIWQAGKNMAADLLRDPQTRVKPSLDSEEVLALASELVTECLRKTQVYDSVYVRSGHMRNPSYAAKAVTPFMGEPTVGINNLAEGALHAARGIGEKNYKVKTRGREISAQRSLIEKWSTVWAASTLASVAAALVKALEDDDEEDKERTYLEKLAPRLADAVWDPWAIVNMVPYARDLLSLSRGYGATRPELQLVEDFMDTVEKFEKAVSAEEKDGDMVANRVIDVATEAASFTKIPIRNLVKTVRGLIATFSSPALWETDHAGIMGALKDWNDAEMLYQAYLDGDQKAVERYTSRFKDEDGNVDVSLARQELRAVIRERDARVREATDYRMAGNLTLFEELMSEMKGEKIFDANLLISAVNSEENAVRREQKKTASLTVSDKEVTVLALYYAVHVNEAFERGDTEDALHMIEEIVSAKMENGKTEKEARAEMKRGMTSYWKDLYVAGDKTRREEIINILVASGLYGTKSKVRETVGDWLKA